MTSSGRGGLPGGVLPLAAAAVGTVAPFYAFYSAASVLLADASPGPAVRVPIVMVAVVLVQPLAVLAGSLLRNRKRVVAGSAAVMALGCATLPVANWWLGPLLLGAGFGLYIVIGNAWAKELADADSVGRAMGIFGFGTAVGGAIGAPVGLLLTTQLGATGLVVGLTVSATIGLALLALVPPGSPIPVQLDPAAPTEPAAQPTGGWELPGTPKRGRRSAAVPVALVFHLLAVTAYAVVLSAAGTRPEGATAAVLVALAVQSTAAVGRLLGGVLCDRWSIPGTGVLAGVLLAAGAVAYPFVDGPLLVILAGSAVGLGAGSSQTTALTLMMRRARTPRDVERSSAAWNIAFDTGLGLGALVLGLLAG